METIKNYLESMFLSLPNTPEIYRAKDELWQMMEDKYTELKENGKSENEAIAIVISEFGNLNEIAKDLGIDSVVVSHTNDEKKLFTIDMAKDYIKCFHIRSTLISVGVMLCILSVCFPIFSELAESFVPYLADMLEAVSVCLMLLTIAVAVGLFVYANIMSNKWSYVTSTPLITDFKATDYINERMNQYRTVYAITMVIGIALCIVSIIPAIMADALTYVMPGDSADCIAGGSLFIIVSIGVMLIVNSALNMNIYKSLLSLNDDSTVSGNYVHSQKKKNVYDNPLVADIMSVFYPTVTCIYLCVSFITFDWHITWIIWPVAAVINALAENIFGHK